MCANVDKGDFLFNSVNYIENKWLNVLHMQHKCCLCAANAAKQHQLSDIVGNDQDSANLCHLCCTTGIKNDDYLDNLL